MNNYNEEVGNRIYDIRTEKKITLKELGDLVGLSESTVQRYEKGKIKNVDIEIVKKFADALKISPAYLMGWEKVDEDFNFSTSLSYTYFRGLIKWSEDKLLKKYESSIIRAHMAELFLRYKKVIEELVYAQRRWDESMEMFSKFYKEKKDPLSDREIKELFLKQELEQSINDLASWIKSLPLWVTSEELTYTDKCKKESEIIELPKEEDTPDYLELNAARPLKGSTEEDRKHDDEIMDDPNF